MTGRWRGAPVALFLVALTVACGGSTTSEAFGAGDGGRLADGGGSDGGSSSGDGGGSQDGSSGVNTACSGPGECVLGEPGCCGVGCGMPALSSYVAIHRGETSALRAATCDSPQPVDCPACASVRDPAFQAFCREKKCVLVDVRKDAVSACKTDDDCVLRPASCCPCGLVSANDLVALSKVAVESYRKQVCDPAAACPRCPWELPTNARARCDGARNHCEVDPN